MGGQQWGAACHSMVKSGPECNAKRGYKTSEFVGGSLQCRRGIVVILWMSLVDVVVGDLVTCMSLQCRPAAW